MYTSARENCLYNIGQGTETMVDIYQGKNKIDVCQFLDDVSNWINDNRQYISSEYLPFAVMAVGTTTEHISAFFFGFFLGKLFEQKKLRTVYIEKYIGRDGVLKKMHSNTYKYNGIFKRRRESADATESPEEA